jgi:MFS family permease
MAGPLIAFGLLALAPGDFDPIFVVSFCFALVGLGILLLFVRNPRVESEPQVRESPSLRGMIEALRTGGLGRLSAVAAGLGLFTVGDAFLYLTLDRSANVATSAFPLLFVGTALVYMLLAIPAGRLADRIGRVRVLVTGYLSLLAVYAVLLARIDGFFAVLACLTLLGAYYAATDGVLMAMASAVLPPHLRGTGLATVVTVSSLARFASSLAFGAVWVVVGVDAALLVFLVGLATALGIAIGLLRRSVTAPA